VVQYLHANNLIPDALQFNDNWTRYLQYDWISENLSDRQFHALPYEFFQEQAFRFHVKVQETFDHVDSWIIATSETERLLEKDPIIAAVLEDLHWIIESEADPKIQDIITRSANHVINFVFGNRLKSKIDFKYYDDYIW
jgi:hypothetical protein